MKKLDEIQTTLETAAHWVVEKFTGAPAGRSGAQESPHPPPRRENTMERAPLRAGAQMPRAVTLEEEKCTLGPGGGALAPYALQCPSSTLFWPCLVLHQLSPELQSRAKKLGFEVKYLLCAPGPVLCIPLRNSLK